MELGGANFFGKNIELLVGQGEVDAEIQTVIHRHATLVSIPTPVRLLVCFARLLMCFACLLMPPRMLALLGRSRACAPRLLV